MCHNYLSSLILYFNLPCGVFDEAEVYVCVFFSVCKVEFVNIFIMTSELESYLSSVNFRYLKITK